MILFHRSLLGQKSAGQRFYELSPKAKCPLVSNPTFRCLTQHSGVLCKPNLIDLNKASVQTDTPLPPPPSLLLPNSLTNAPVMSPKNHSRSRTDLSTQIELTKMNQNPSRPSGCLQHSWSSLTTSQHQKMQKVLHVIYGRERGPKLWLPLLQANPLPKTQVPALILEFDLTLDCQMLDQMVHQWEHHYQMVALLPIFLQTPMVLALAHHHHSGPTQTD
jgi:hypothetical protein